ncbi:tRNA-queuosine alpha-mannosyltransferase-like [Clavelina lepadiformis]|uniref:tRNA-queuosine alpha-mannosyltransferase-like n=1 Tax=Clavelina lepadiformis TaxID=159417 RepID=UPI004041D31C
MCEIERDLIILEPFYGGSHKQLMDTITTTIDKEANPAFKYDLLTMPAKKWQWKARTGALYFAMAINADVKYRTLLCDGVLNLCELLGLCPSLMSCKKVVYFHENQLVYPVRSRQDGDFQYGYNQILTALAADVVVFNSRFNMESFLSNISSFLKLIPDHRPKSLEDIIRPKCKNVYFPLANVPSFVNSVKPEFTADVLQLVWAHRWEHDKDPKTFFDTILELKENGFQFQVSVLGEQFSKNPPIFEQARVKLGPKYIKHWGYIEEKQAFYEILASADVAVSTAIHEFFGVSMLEAAFLKCFPLCPNRLSYPEIFPESCLYNTPRQLYKRLKSYCKNKTLVQQHFNALNFSLHRFTWENLKHDYLSLISSDYSK